jgi:hypothetical protein
MKCLLVHHRVMEKKVIHTTSAKTVLGSTEK